MAGQIAETHQLGRRVKAGMHQDNCNAVDLAFQLCGSQNDTAQAVLDWLYLDTRDRLTAPRSSQRGRFGNTSYLISRTGRTLTHISRQSNG